MLKHIHRYAVCLCALLPNVRADTKGSINDSGTGQNALVNHAKNEPGPARVEDQRPGDQQWNQLLTAMQKRDEVVAKASIKSHPADQAKDFYTRYPQHQKSKEARKLEAVSLVEAVADGEAQLGGRMEAAVKAVRADQSLARFDRAVVAGTYEFTQAYKRCSSPADLSREFVAVSRKLIQEFPDQPQGYVSLLTQADHHDAATALSLIGEVVDSSAPEDVKVRARQLQTRYNLVGKSIGAVLGDGITTEKRNIWKPAKPGLFYFWTTTNVDSITFGKDLIQRQMGGYNILSVCIDQTGNGSDDEIDVGSMAGYKVFLSKEPDRGLRERLAGFDAPCLYLVDERGIVTDVCGLVDFENKLTAFEKGAASK